MTLVDADTGEIVDACDKAEAERLTAMIRSAAEDLWSLLLEAHDRRAWAALGHASWASYVDAEFDMSRQHAYRLLDQGRVIREVEAAVDVVSPMGDEVAIHIPERQARDVKPNLKAVTSEIQKQIVAEASAPPAERIREIVAEVVGEERAKVAQRSEDRQAMADLNEQGAKAGMDLDKRSLAERGGFSTNCRELSKLPAPADFIGRHRSFLSDRHIAQAEAAYEWLDGFLIELREAE